ncbi:MAG: hypothetical protein K2W82_17165 [Candidatus Obscuribacterales bacterium]|nr:hypothetical protein [Candidatus Obscuribacterales bacterium]
MALDRSKLTKPAQADTGAQQRSAADSCFVEVIDGLRLAHQQTRCLRMVSGDGSFTPEGRTQVTLHGAALLLWKLCQPLAPQLWAFREWVGSQDSGCQETGYYMLVNWPDEAKRQELLQKQAGDAHIRKICDAFTAGLAAVDKRAEATLAAVQEVCETRAREEWSWASVMVLAPGKDFAYPSDYPEHGGSGLKPEWLGPAAAKVFAALAADDKPRLRARNQHAGDTKSYYDIVLDFDV